MLTTKEKKEMETQTPPTTNTSRRGGNAPPPPPPPPPQLIFDDGSRIMAEFPWTPLDTVTLHSDIENISRNNSRGDIPLHEYYEIDRISQEVLDICLSSDRMNNGDNDGQKDQQQRQPSMYQQQTQNDPRILRIALQFPDELLIDSPDVCWLLEEKLQVDLTNRTMSTVVANVDEDNNNNNPHLVESQLGDSPSNCNSSNRNIVPFCFVLGDTTANSCCPDEVSALHLNADVLVHYGHACLSPTGSLPVVYSFGKKKLDVDSTVQALEVERKRRQQTAGVLSRSEKYLLLYQVGYHHAMKELQQKWLNVQPTDDSGLQVLIGEIPTQANSHRQQPPAVNATKTISSSLSCCGDTEGMCSSSIDQPRRCKDGAAEEDESKIVPNRPQCGTSTCTMQQQCQDDNQSTRSRLSQPEQPSFDDVDVRPLIVGGLELPRSIRSWDDLADFTVIFIMDGPVNSFGESRYERQYVNSMLCFLSLPNPPRGGYWIYTPTDTSLRTDDEPPVALQRQLKRRFFLTQRARDANVFGILVSNLSQQHLVRVVQSLQAIIQNAGKTSYSFAVGKINPAKIANFAEIDCFCLVACREHSLLDDEREYPVPVITPMELEMALDASRAVQWGTLAYSLDCQDVMIRQQQHSNGTTGAIKDQDVIQDGDEGMDNDDDTDAPYFSLVTGMYVSKQATSSASVTTTNNNNDLDLSNLPGKGQVTEYKSEAAIFLKQREYQGLQSLVGQTEAKAAVQGLTGIASGYTGVDEVPAS